MKLDFKAVVFALSIAASIAGCGGQHETSPGPCGDLWGSADIAVVSPGPGVESIILAHSTLAAEPFELDVLVVFAAKRRIETSTGVAKIGVPAYHFVRLKLDGVFWQNLPSSGVADTDKPLSAGQCLKVDHAIAGAVRVPASKKLSAESVWVLVKPGEAEALVAITDEAVMVLRK